MNRLTGLTAGAACASVILFGTVIGVPQSASPDESPLALQVIRELRVHDMPADEDPWMVFTETPELVLEFDVALPKGTRVLQIAQPASVKAVDSTGGDLSQIEPNFHDEREYVEVVESFNEEMPSRLRVHLTPSARAAATFDVRMQFTAVTSSKTEAVAVDLTDQWQPLKARTGDGVMLEARIADAWGSRSIEVRPDTATDMIQAVTMTVDGEELENFGWSSDGQTVHYNLSGEVPEAGRVQFTVYGGLDTVSLRLDLKKQPLP